MWNRNVLEAKAAEQVGSALQPLLVELIDLALVGKQAHWAVFGSEFLAVHEKLDEVVALARKYGDAVAERMVQVGIVPDGRVSTVAQNSELPAYPDKFVDVPGTITAVCNALEAVARRVREARAGVEEPDPLTEDLCIEIGQAIEEQLWMFQAMEGHDPNQSRRKSSRDAVARV